jgi:hypothetical protein
VARATIIFFCALAHAEPVPPPPPPEWVHPLGERALPLNDSRKFGAHRPYHRPAECKRGHCGVDLGSTRGDPVFAVYDGVVERIERDADRDPKSGRYVRLSHQSGHIVTRYIHLDSIRDDLRPGDRVKGGDLIGRLGATGVFNSGPHLHFAVSLREKGGERYVDPEPFLLSWSLKDEPPIAKDTPIASTRPAVERRWVPEHFIWHADGWVRIEAGWRTPRPSSQPPPRWVAFWQAPHWWWNGAGWVWVAGMWRVHSPI